MLGKGERRFQWIGTGYTLCHLCGRVVRLRGREWSSRMPGQKRAARRTTAPGGTAAGRKPLRIDAILRRLADEAPLPPWRTTGDPVAELVLTLLSQNTSDTNSGRAYQRLVARYPTWDAVVAAPTPELEETIRVGGLAKTKAPRVQALLREVKERARAWPGERWDLPGLESMPLEDAKAWLTALPGVGPKTAACVLLFALGRPALPVDTHVHRVSGRLGLIGPKVGAAEAHTVLEALVPPKRYYAFHMALIRHGRRVCKAQRPLCGECVLADRCPSFSVLAPGVGKASR